MPHPLKSNIKIAATTWQNMLKDFFILLIFFFFCEIDISSSKIAQALQFVQPTPKHTHINSCKIVQNRILRKLAMQIYKIIFQMLFYFLIFSLLTRKEKKFETTIKKK